MIRVCMACGKEQEVEPLDLKETSHGICSQDICERIFVKWSESLSLQGISLRRFHMEVVSPIVITKDGRLM